MKRENFKDSRIKVNRFPLMNQKYDEIYAVCEQAFGLRWIGYDLFYDS